VLIAVGYGKLRPPFLGARPASLAHRASGDAIVAITVVVAVMCLSYYGFEEGEKALHMVAGTALLVALALKVAVVRRLDGLSRYLPVIGIRLRAPRAHLGELGGPVPRRSLRWTARDSTSLS
jgi:hypothetical protein